MMDTLNKLNRTGWVINMKVLEVFDFYINNEVSKSPLKHKSMAANSLRDRQIRDSHKLRAEVCLKMANLLKNDVFYHTYNLDFRGRIYPTTVFLHEQAGDYGKALLCFSKGSIITETGLKHMLLNGANCYGMDKLSIEEKLRFMEENKNMFLRIAKNPYDNTEWMDAEEPFKFLSFCFEYNGYMEDPENYVTNVPIYVDASCNGSQHLSAMSKDDIIGPLVNLTPSDRPARTFIPISLKWPGKN